MATNRKQYDDKFKRAAVERTRKGESAVEVAKELKIADSMLYSWRKKFAESTVPEPQPEKPGGRTKEAIVYLRHARDAMKDEINQGKVKHRLKSHLLMELALWTLSGE